MKMHGNLPQSIYGFLSWRMAMASFAIGVLALLPNIANAATPSGTLLPRDLSPWGMFVNADLVVKAVMLGLAFASLVTWTICVAKLLELRTETGHAKNRVKMLENDVSLIEAERNSKDGTDAVAQLIHSAAREANLSGGIFDDGFKERITLRLRTG